jgi:hypothetical protein
MHRKGIEATNAIQSFISNVSDFTAYQHGSGELKATDDTTQRTTQSYIERYRDV